MELYFRAFPWMWQGLAVSAVVAIAWFVVRKLVWRRTAWHRVLFEAALAGWLICFFTVTLSSSTGDIQPGQGRGWCVLNPSSPLGLQQSIGTRELNTLVLVPVGFMAAVAVGRRFAWLIAGVCAPVVAEFVQYLVPGLGRV